VRSLEKGIGIGIEGTQQWELYHSRAATLDFLLYLFQGWRTFQLQHADRPTKQTAPTGGSHLTIPAVWLPPRRLEGTGLALAVGPLTLAALTPKIPVLIRRFPPTATEGSTGGFVLLFANV
jgi:hypothetical protein